MLTGKIKQINKENLDEAEVEGMRDEDEGEEEKAGRERHFKQEIVSVMMKRREERERDVERGSREGLV